MTPASSKTQIIWLEDRVNGLEKRLEQVERLNKATPPEDDLNNVRYKANYRYETKQPLTQAQMDALCNAYLCYQEESPELSGIYKLIREVELTHGIGEKE
jgi:hypothetical protein